MGAFPLVKAFMAPTMILVRLKRLCQLKGASINKAVLPDFCFVPQDRFTPHQGESRVGGFVAIISRCHIAE